MPGIVLGIEGYNDEEKKTCSYGFLGRERATLINVQL